MNSQCEELFSMNTVLDSIVRNNGKVKDHDDYIKTMLNINGYLVERPLIKPSSVRKMIRDLGEVQRDLGVWPAFIVCKEFKKEITISKMNVRDQEDSGNLLKMAENFLDFCMQFYKRIIKSYNGINKEDVMLNLITSKLCRLIDIIELYKGSEGKFSAIVFVDRVLYSFAIAKYLDELSQISEVRFNYLRSNFFVGNNNDYLNLKFIKQAIKNFKHTIKEFKDGKLNLLVSTSVLEEGIDIGKCNLVIRFSEPKTYREFVQSKGRARAKNSHFFIIHDDSIKINKEMKKYDDTEEFLNHRFQLSSQEKWNESVLPDDYKVSSEDDEFIHSSTGSKMSLHEAAPFLNRYIIKKGGKNHLSSYSIKKTKLGFKANLSLQGLTLIENDIEGKTKDDEIEAFQSACLEACKKLYEQGQLNDHFIPISDEMVRLKFKIKTN